MPVTIVGLDQASTPVRSAPSALIELGCALHTLRDPGHHGAGEWAEGIGSRMSPDLRARTRLWSWTTRAIRSGPFVTLPAPSESFACQLERLRAEPTEHLADQLLRPICRTTDRRIALRFGRARGTDAAQTIEALIARPARATADFIDFLEQSWHEWFAAEWQRIEPTLSERARRLSHTLQRTGPAGALAQLDRSVTGIAGGIRIAKVQNARHDVTRRGLIVVPSTFIDPHLYVGNVAGCPVLLIYPAAPVSGPALVPADIMRRLSALTHAGRLEVARAIATEPRTASEIATLWRMDPTVVTRHLRTLAQAGLAHTERSGRFVQYRLDLTAVGSLGPDLAALLIR